MVKKRRARLKTSKKKTFSGKANLKLKKKAKILKFRPRTFSRSFAYYFPKLWRVFYFKKKEIKKKLTSSCQFVLHLKRKIWFEISRHYKFAEANFRYKVKSVRSEIRKFQTKKSAKISGLWETIQLIKPWLNRLSPFGLGKSKILSKINKKADSKNPASVAFDKQPVDLSPDRHLHYSNSKKAVKGLVVEKQSDSSGAY